MTIAKLPLAKDVVDFVLDDTGINETLVGDLAAGNFLTTQSNIVLVGGTETGKIHLPIAIAEPVSVMVRRAASSTSSIW